MHDRPERSTGQPNILPAIARNKMQDFRLASGARAAPKPIPQSNWNIKRNDPGHTILLREFSPPRGLNTYLPY